MIRRRPMLASIGVLSGALCWGLLGCSSGEEPAAGPADSSAPVPSTASPDFDRHGVAHLGYVEPGSTRELVYTLHAPEDEDITGLGIDSDCPCVEAVDLPARVNAGESQAIRIRFKAPDKVLRYRQDLAIYGTVDGERVETWLALDARLGLPLQVSTEEVRLTPGAETIEVQLRNDGEDSISFIYALSNDPAVKLVTPNTPLLPGDHNVLSLSIEIEPGWSGPAPAKLTIKTTCDDQPEVRVWVYPNQ